ncbi:MAG: SDR family NAD(P)-dependent oxidoreductase [Deltaproteobacteria bacterium]|nr:SDR family NAD(P)-dependent oxidoreductase [Deltaproteobacteria bacterium]
MSKELRFDDKVAVITGAGNGLGRSHALMFAARGAKVVVNDLGGGFTGGGKGSEAADRVVAEIKAAGGQAVPNYDSVEDGANIIKTAIDAFGRVDIVVNNAGILRDVSFQKMTPEDWDLIYRVHVLGAYRVTHAAWNLMRDQGYGRIIMTASAAGIYGNFGQANYSMAKLGVVGFGSTLALEGGRRNVHVNSIAPLAGSRMTETVLPKELLDALKPEYVTPLVMWLCHESCEENGGLFEVGGGFFGKLRWERAEGLMLRTGRNITVEDVKRAWPKITGFDKVTHPANVAESLQPILTNAQAGPSKGGNEFIDVDAALGYEFPEVSSSYKEQEAAFYALAVGAAANPLDEKELPLVYEMHGKGFKVLPTFGVIPALSTIMEQAKKGVTAPGLNYGFDRILHGEQFTQVMRPLPSKATLKHRVKIKDIYDKGKNAVVVTEIKSFDEDGEELVRNELTAVVRGAGGWGGDRGPSNDVAYPERAPDAKFEAKIPENQALLYRLTGDWNPLHADPSFAKAFGFEKPILHGLCTYGFAARQAITAFCDGDPSLFKSIRVRFADSVFPGETLVTELWKESKNRILARCKVKDRDKVVLTNAVIELYDEVPKKKEKAKAAAAPQAGAPAASAEPASADVFTAIGGYLKANPDMAGKVQTVFQFKLSNPDSLYTLDLKNGSGSCTVGETAKSECTLELSDADFMDMCTGKADPNKLYFGGKLKISGNVMASQKLTFLQKIDPAMVMAAAKARVASGGGGAATGATAAAPASDKLTSADVFAAIRDYVQKNAETVKAIGVVFQFRLTSPESVWTVDLKQGAVDAGEAAKSECTLELSDENFMAMTSGKADPQKLYFGGQLKISGNVMASQKLSFLQKIDVNQAKAAITAARASGAGQAAAATTGPKKAEKVAGLVFEKLATRLAAKPDLAAEVGAVVCFKVDGQAWTVDFKQKGTMKSGADATAETTVTMDDESLGQVAKGEQTLQALFQNGKARVDGAMRPVHKVALLMAGLL